MKLDTNYVAIKALNYSDIMNTNIENSIERLSSGKRIQNAEDDASNMAIADSLRQQSLSIKEAVKNANDGIGMMQIADKGIGQQIDLLTQIRNKAIAATNDVHSEASINALQEEISKLLDELNRVANTTTYNGISMLGGGFINKDFHIGVNDESFIRTSINKTTTDNIGVTKYETGTTITAASVVQLQFKNLDGSAHFLEETIISTSSDTGLNILANNINKNSDYLGIKAKAVVISIGSAPIGSVLPDSGIDPNDTVIEDIKLNGVSVGNVDISGIGGKDDLVAALNQVQRDTGIKATLDIKGHLQLISTDGRGIHLTTKRNGHLLNLSSERGGQTINHLAGDNQSTTGHQNYGRLTLTRLNSTKDINIGGVNYTAIGFNGQVEAQSIINLNNIKNSFSIDQACAMGAYPSLNAEYLTSNRDINKIKPGILTSIGANAIMDSIDIAMNNLQDIRAEISAVQNKLKSTIDSAVNLKNNLQSSESQLRDTDFGEETTNIQLQKLLMQANIYAITKSNSIREMLLELLR